jgi:signal transduction histidine kinase
VNACKRKKLHHPGWLRQQPIRVFKGKTGTRYCAIVSDTGAGLFGYQSNFATTPIRPSVAKCVGSNPYFINIYKIISSGENPLKKLSGMSALLTCLRYALALFILAPSVWGFAQQQRLDSLLQEVRTARKPDLEQLFDLASVELSKLPFDRSFNIANEFLSQAGRNNQPYATVLAYRNLSRVCSAGKQEVKGLEYIQQGLSFARERGDAFEIGMAQYNVVDFLHQQKLFAAALENALQAIQTFKSIGDQAHVTACHYLAASIHYEATNYRQCIEEGEQVIKYYRTLNPKSVTRTDDFVAMSMYNTMGLSHVAIQENDKAIQNYDSAERIARKIQDKFWIGLVSGNRAIAYKAMGRMHEAMTNLRTDLFVSQEHAQWLSAGMAAAAISELHLDKRKLDSAQFYLNLAQTLFKKASSYPSGYWRVLSKVKAARGDHKEAYEAQARYNFLRDSAQQKRDLLNLVKIKNDFELSQKQNEIEELARNNALSNERIRTQNIIIGITVLSVGLLVILMTTLIRGNKKKEKTNALIVSLNENLEAKISERTRELKTAMHELDTFLYRSSHDMRRPLSTLLGLENLAKTELKDSTSLKLFAMMGDTVRSMDRMLRKLQTGYDINQMEAQWECVSVETLIVELRRNFREMFPGRDFSFQVNPRASVTTILTDSHLLSIVLTNVLENAGHFSKSETDSKIQLVFSEHADSNEFIISDNGVGIEELNLPRIFDQYFIGTDRSKGNGLGLFIAKKAAQKLGGTIHVRSEYGVGSTFIVRLPKRGS